MLRLLNSIRSTPKLHRGFSHCRVRTSVTHTQPWSPDVVYKRHWRRLSIYIPRTPSLSNTAYTHACERSAEKPRCRAAATFVSRCASLLFSCCAPQLPQVEDFNSLVQGTSPSALQQCCGNYLFNPSHFGEIPVTHVRSYQSQRSQAKAGTE